MVSPVRGRWATVGIAVAAATLLIEVAYGVRIGDALRYLGYEAAYTVIPGWLVYRALATRPGSPIRQLALGWTVGLALGVLAYIACAAADARDAYALYPLVVGIPAVAAIARRRRPSGDDPLDSGSVALRWTTAAVAVAAIALLAIAYFPATPLPGAGAVSYFRDFLWNLGLAAEARNHWPILDPNVAGEPLPYHYFAHIHIAAASQITGLGLPLIFFRLFVPPLIALVVGLFVVAGSSLTRSGWVGVAAAGLALFVGELQLDTSQQVLAHVPFLGTFVNFLATSPSFLFGLPIFLALVVLIGEMLTRVDRASAGDWVLLGIVVAGATNAKIVILPLVLLALLLLIGWRLLRRERPPAAAGGVIALILAAVGLIYLTQYAGHSGGMSLGWATTFDQMPVVQAVKSYLEHSLPTFPPVSAFLAIGGIGLGVTGLLGLQILGLACLRGRPRTELAWLIAFVVATLLIMLFLSAPGTGNQLYFVFYGVAAGWLGAARGFADLIGRRPREIDSWRRPALLAIAVILALVLVQRFPLDIHRFVGVDAAPQQYLVWYGGLFLLVVAFCVVASRLLRPFAWWTAAFVAAVFLFVGAMGTVVDFVAPAARGEASAFAATDVDNTVTSEQYDAMTWLRENTPTDTVIATNIQKPAAFTWSAFAERRVFLGGPLYTRRSFDRGYDESTSGPGELFPERALLNTAALGGDAGALALLAGSGVDYLVIDPSGDAPVDQAALGRHTSVAYANDEVSILRLDDQPHADREPSAPAT